MQSAPNEHKQLSLVAVDHRASECLSHLSAPAWSVVAQDAGGVGPGLVSHTAEQHRMFPAPRPQPAPPAQTLPHRQPHRLRLRHRGVGRQLPLTAAHRHTG